MAEGDRERERVVAQGLWPQERASGLLVETSTPSSGKEGKVGLQGPPEAAESPEERRMGSPEERPKSGDGGRPFAAGLPRASPTSR